MSDADLRWIATLDDGTTAVEHSGEYEIIPGLRKPWVRLVNHLADNDLALTSLRLNFRGRTIHLPREKFDRFNLGEMSYPPSFYSLSYIHEADIGNEMTQAEYVDLTAHFEGFEVHYIQDVTDGNNSWVVTTKDFQPMAATPRSKG